MTQTAPPQSLKDFDGTPDLRRLQDLTGNFYHLQGLRLIPIGLFFLANVVFWRDEVEPKAFLLTFSAAMLLYAWIGTYYKRAFGRVRRRLRDQLRDGAAGGFFLVLVFTSFWAEARFSPPLSLIGLAVAAFFLYIYVISGCQRRHHLAVAAAFALLGLLPLTGLMAPGAFFGSGKVLGNLSLGITYVLVGVFDHLYLVKNLKPIPRESDDDAL